MCDTGEISEVAVFEYSPSEYLTEDSIFKAVLSGREEDVSLLVYYSAHQDQVFKKSEKFKSGDSTKLARVHDVQEELYFHNESGGCPANSFENLKHVLIKDDNGFLSLFAKITSTYQWER